MKKMENNVEPSEILKQPYARIVVPEVDGSYTAEILEFPGCVASGDTSAEALSNVEDVAVDWIAATREQGQDIPPPLDNARYSGKLVLRMPKGLHKRASVAAERDGVSLNQFIVTCLAEHVGEKSASRRRLTIHTAPQYQNVNVVMFNGNLPAVWVRSAADPLIAKQSPLVTSSWGQNARS